MGALDPALHPIAPSECFDMFSLLDDIHPSDETFLKDMIKYEIPLDFDILSKYHLLGLDLVAIKSIPDFPFESNRPLYRSSNIGIF